MHLLRNLHVKGLSRKGPPGSRLHHTRAIQGWSRPEPMFMASVTGQLCPQPHANLYVSAPGTRNSTVTLTRVRAFLRSLKQNRVFGVVVMTVCPYKKKLGPRSQREEHVGTQTTCQPKRDGGLSPLAQLQQNASLDNL